MSSDLKGSCLREGKGKELGESGQEGLSWACCLHGGYRVDRKSWSPWRGHIGRSSLTCHPADENTLTTQLNVRRELPGGRACCFSPVL